MKQKDKFWCGAVLFTLMMFISLQIVQGLLAGIAGGFCALAAVILFGCGLKADEQEKTSVELKRVEAEQEQIEAQHRIHTEDFEHTQRMIESLKEEIQSYATALNQIQTDIAATVEELQTLHKAVTVGSQSQLKVLAQFSEDVKKCFESDQIQAKENVKLMCELNREQHVALCKVLEMQGTKSEKYYGFMIEQPWAEIRVLSQNLQSIANQVDSVLSLLDDIQSETEEQFQETLKQLQEDGKSLQGKLQYVCEAIKQQDKENRDAMERVMQGYSDITAQDIELLTALARDIKV